MFPRLVVSENLLLHREGQPQRLFAERRVHVCQINPTGHEGVVLVSEIPVPEVFIRRLTVVPDYSYRVAGQREDADRRGSLVRTGQVPEPDELIEAAVL